MFFKYYESGKDLRIGCDEREEKAETGDSEAFGDRRGHPDSYARRERTLRTRNIRRAEPRQQTFWQARVW